MGAFGREFPGIAADLQRALARTAKVKLGEAAEAQVKALTPVGGEKDRHPGMLKASWQRQASGADSAPEVIGSDAPHARVINRGRKRSKTIKGREKRTRRKGAKPVANGKMMGSPLARGGMTRPAVRLIMKRREQITAQIVAAVESGSGGSR
jgi:hypothetical protein